MEDVKEESVRAENGSESFGELSSPAKLAYEQLQIAMNSVFMVYDMPFKWLMEAVE